MIEALTSRSMNNPRKGIKIIMIKLVEKSTDNIESMLIISICQLNRQKHINFQFSIFVFYCLVAHLQLRNIGLQKCLVHLITHWSKAHLWKCFAKKRKERNIVLTNISKIKFECKFVVMVSRRIYCTDIWYFDWLTWHILEYLEFRWTDKWK